MVDDQQSNVKLLEFALKRTGYTAVSSTLDPCEVTALHTANRFDLIVLDLQMPQLNGFEVMAQLNEIREALPVDILVMSAGSTEKRAALDAGATAFLAKPFKIPDLVAQIHLMLSASMPHDRQP